jgi:drug/metabolite transporter (DMT)-like permease
MDSRRTLLVFIVITVLFGTTFPAIKAGLDFFPPLLFATFRYALSGLVLLSYAAARMEYWRPRSRRDWTGVLAGGVLFIGGTGLTFVGQQFITSGVAAILVSLSPILTVLFGWVLLPAERLSRRGMAGVVVGFVGVALVVRPTVATLLDPAGVGKILVLVATFSVTLGTVLVRRVQAPLPIPALTGWSMLVGATLQAGGSVIAGESLAAVRLTPLSVATVLYLGVLAGAVAFGLYFWLLARVGALEANLVTYLTPPVTLAVGWLVLDEAVGLEALVGFAVIAVGFVLLRERDLAARLAKYRGPAR